MSVAVVAPPHPVLGCAAEMRAALDAVAAVQPTYMSTADKQTALVELARIEGRVAELRMRVLAASGEVGEESGARDAAAWLAHATKAEPATTRSDAVLAERLERRPLVATAMREGRVSPAQARVVAAVLEDLPAHLGQEVATDAEITLVAFCEHFRPSELRRLARRLLEVVAPEVAEAEEAKRLEEEERRALAEAFLKFHDLGNGLTRFWGALPTAVAERLKRYLQAYSSPRRTKKRGGPCEDDHSPDPAAPTGTGERVPAHRAHARAFAALLELLDPDRLPEHGGDATTVIITMTLDQLLTDLATAGMASTGNADGEITISAEEARRLACQAGLVPVVLDGKGQPLDVGRASRLYRAPQRRAIRLRDRRCRAEGCTIPAAWCEVHHREPWSQGGRTDIADGVCFCSHHHHLVHDRAYDHHWTAQGDVRFHRRR